MIILPDLEAEHAQLESYMDQIDQVTAAREPASPEDVEMLIGCFSQLLRIHLLREDGILYPAMLTAPGKPAAAAARLRGDLASMTARLEQFEGWSVEAIVARWDDLRNGLAALVQELRARIAREACELYPFVPRVAAPRQPPAPVVPPVFYVGDIPE